MINYMRKILEKYADKKLEFILLLIVLTLLIIWQLNVDTIILGISLFAILLYGWRSGFIEKGIKRIAQDIKSKIMYTFLLAIILSLLLMWKFNVQIIIFVAVFLAFIFYKWDSRFIISIGLSLLGIVPIILVFRKETFVVEIIVVYAYYFLITGLLLQIIEYCKDLKINKL